MNTIELGALAETKRLRSLRETLIAYRRGLDQEPACYRVSQGAWQDIQSQLVGWNERRTRIGQPRIEAVTLGGVPVEPAGS